MSFWGWVGLIFFAIVGWNLIQWGIRTNDEAKAEEEARASRKRAEDATSEMERVRTQVTKDLNKITQPVFLTCGQFDEAVPTATAFYCEQFPNASMLVLENASHLHNLEQSEQYLAAVREFLQRKDTN